MLSTGIDQKACIVVTEPMGSAQKDDTFKRLARKQTETLAQCYVPFRAGERLSRYEVHKGKPVITRAITF